MRKILITCVLLFGCFVVLHASARAGTTCTIGTAALSFGSFDVYAGAVSATGTVTVSCTGAGTTPVLSLSTGGSGTYADRAMACVSGCASGDVLKYNIYTDATLATVLGDGTSSTGTLSFGALKNNTSATLNIFGQIHAAVAGGMNDVSVGSYSDTITCTINY